jgi:hypothetical protein
LSSTMPSPAMSPRSKSRSFILYPVRLLVIFFLFLSKENTGNAKAWRYVWFVPTWNKTEIPLTCLCFWSYIHLTGKSAISLLLYSMSTNVC